VAYALGTKPPELVSPEVHEAYSRAKMAEDLRETPAHIPPAVLDSIISGGRPYIN